MKKLYPFIFTALCFCVFLNKATAQFSGGNGSENNPYIITTAAQLAQLATYVNDGNANYNNKCYKLGNDIDLSAYQSGTGWIPIGNSEKVFWGIFDGNNKIITKLYINNPNLNYVGLFGYIIGATVRNLGVENVFVKGGLDVGAVVGYVSYDHGSNTSSSIQNCYSTGEVSGSAVVGGIAGYVIGVITNCYSTCRVNGSGNMTGGIAGRIYNSSGIWRCYYTGEVSGERCIGGIVGYSSEYSLTEYCVVLSPSVKSNNLAGRIYGDSWNFSLFGDNAAWEGILNFEGNTIWNKKGANINDGVDMTLQTIKTDGSLGGRFKTTDGWTIQNGKLPGLFGKPVNMPAHLGGVGIDELQVTSYELQVYPNPTTGELRVTSDELQVTSMEIFDVYGRAVSTHYSLLTTHYSMDISHLPAGIYFLKIETEKGPVVKKVVKQ